MKLRLSAAAALLGSGLALSACQTATPAAPTTGGEMPGGTAATTMGTAAYPGSATASAAASPQAMATTNAAQTAAAAFVDGGPHYVAAKALAEALDAKQVPLVVVD